MAYLGVSPSNGVRQKHTYTATANQTSFSGAGAENITLSYKDSNYVDVYQNGVKLSEADYTATSGTAIVLATGATVSDMIEIVVYDVFSVADTVSKADGGQFDGNVTMAGTLGVTGETTLATHLNLGDDDKIKLGASADLEIYHSGSGSYISDTGTGFLFIQGASQIRLQNPSGSNYAIFTDGGASTLYHNNSAKFATTSTGIDITGTVVSDGMSTNTAGTSNFIAGVNAGNSITSGGNYNTVVGDEAGTALTTGDHNTAIGFSALDAEDAGTGSVAIGNYALSTQNADGNNYNTAVGYVAGSNITTATQNTLIGALSGDALVDGAANTALGFETLTADTKGQNNVAIGHHALSTQNFTSLTSSYNTAVGSQAGLSITTGTLNTLIGGLAGDALNTGTENVALGYNALGADVKGNNSIAIGSKALQTQSFSGATDAYNTAVGHNTGKSVTTGIQNTLIGGLAGDALTDADYNVAIGKGALSADTKGSKSTAVGVGALESQNFTSATNSLNTAVGLNAGNSLTTGTANTLIGAQAGENLTSGQNVAVGQVALQNNVSGAYNTAIGRNALNATTNQYNTAIGNGSGSLITSGQKNTIVGRYNGNQNSFDIRTSSNVLVLSDGDGNPRIVSDSAGKVGIGYASTAYSAQLHSHIAEADNPAADIRSNSSSYTNNVILVGSSTTTTNSTYNHIRADIHGVAQKFAVRDSGNVVNANNSYGSMSDERIKSEIADASSQWNDIKSLKVRKFKKYDTGDELNIGVVAQEVETAGMNGLVEESNPDKYHIAHNSEFGTLDSDGEVNEIKQKVKSVKYSVLYMKAIKALQEAMTRIETLEADVKTLKGE
jgi:hypothetical protein